MEAAKLVLAILLPWSWGTLWIRARWEDPPPGAWALVMGYGYLLGMLALTLLMRLWDAAGLHQNFAGLAVTAALLAGLGLWRQPSFRGWGGTASQSQLQRGAWWGLLLLLAIALLPEALEVILRPLYPWDAWMHWAPKARVWFEWKQLVPFVSGEDWVREARPDVYTMDAYNYPATIPLIQLWMALALDRWDDALINLPWWFCGVALGLAFYGQARAWGIRPLPTLAFAFVVLSLPLVETHMALAGYADLWLAAAYGGAALAFWQWARTRSPRQGLLALLLALACPLIKLAGIAWAATLVFAALGLWRRWLAAALFAIGIAAFALLYGREVAVFGKSFHLTFHDVSSPLLTHLFWWDSWHLLWYLAAALFLFGARRLNRAAALTVSAALAFIGVLFFLTSFAIWVEQGTLVNRMLLHMVPMLAFVLLLRGAR